MFMVFLKAYSHPPQFPDNVRWSFAYLFVTNLSNPTRKLTWRSAQKNITNERLVKCWYRGWKQWVAVLHKWNIYVVKKLISKFLNATTWTCIRAAGTLKLQKRWCHKNLRLFPIWWQSDKNNVFNRHELMKPAQVGNKRSAYKTNFYR